MYYVGATSARERGGRHGCDVTTGTPCRCIFTVAVQCTRDGFNVGRDYLSAINHRHSRTRAQTRRISLSALHIPTLIRIHPIESLIDTKQKNCAFCVRSSELGT